MIKIGNLRIGKGIALIRPKQFQVVGTGTESFIRAIVAEVGGIDLTRSSRVPSEIKREASNDWWVDATNDGSYGV